MAAISNDKLLNSPIVTCPRGSDLTKPEYLSFEAQMAEAGWSVGHPANRTFANFRRIVRRQELLAYETEINAKFFKARRADRALAESA